MLAKPNSLLYRTNFHAFVEKAFRKARNKRLARDQAYLPFVTTCLEDFISGHTQRLLINLPGRHLKTFISSICMPAFALGLDPTLKFLIVSHSDELAEETVDSIRTILNSDWYKKVFATRIKVGDSRRHAFSTTDGGRVRSTPISSLTGKGGDIIIFDDPHNVAHWRHPDKKKQVVDAFNLLMTRLDDGARSRILVVGHRIAHDDLSAHIIQKGTFETICLPLFAPEALVLRHRDHTLTLSKGEALRPDAFPPEKIDEIRSDHTGSPFHLYFQQGYGQSDEDPDLEITDFPILERPKRDYKVGRIPIVLSIDPAQIKDGQSRNVIHAYAIEQDLFTLIDAFADKCSFSELLAQIIHFARRYRASVIIVEATARGPAIIEQLEERLPNTRILPVRPTASKEKRLRQCIPSIKAGAVDVLAGPETEAAIDEIVRFPDADSDDHVDAMTNFLLNIPQLRNVPIPRFDATAKPNGIAISSGSPATLRQIEGAVYLPGLRRSAIATRQPLTIEQRPRAETSIPEDTSAAYVIVSDGLNTKRIRVR